MAFLDTFRGHGADSREQQLLRKYGHRNGDALTRESQGEKVAWQDVTVTYRLRHGDGVFPEEVMTRIAPEAVSALNELAQLLLDEYNSVTIERPHPDLTQYVSVDVGYLANVLITSRPHVPEQTDEEIRRSRFRPAGLAETEMGGVCPRAEVSE